MPSVEIPWRGPGDGRPDLPLPPGPMPLRRDGQNRKRWRYVGLFGEEVMLCAARAADRPADAVLLGPARPPQRRAARPHRAAARQPRGPLRRPGAGDRRPRPARQPAARRVRADRIDLPQRQRLGLDPQARRGADRGHGRDPRPALAGRRLRRRRRVGRLPAAPHQLALVGRGRDGGRRPPAGLEPGRGRQRPAAKQRAGDLDRRHSLRARPGPLRRPAPGSTSPAASASTSPPSRPTPATRTSSSSAPATATASAASAAPSAASSSPTGLGVMERHDAVW